jgi:sporulation protein YlmC with PRC-barrel domain
MKRNTIKFMAMAVAAVVFGQAPAFAADNSNENNQKKPGLLQKLRGSKMKGSKATSAKTGEELGTVEEIIIDGDTGKVQFVILDTGGGLGSQKFTPVPWEAVHVSSDKNMTVKSDKQKIRSAPTVTRDHFSDQNPAEVVAIYEFYEVAPPSGTGGTGTGATGTSGTSTDPGQSQQKDQQQKNQ